MLNKKLSLLYHTACEYLVLMLSISGFVPKNATLPRSVAMIASLAFAVYLAIFQYSNFLLAIIYFTISEFCYIGFIFIILPENGLRHWFIKKWGNEEDGYLTYEAIQGFLFFHNGLSIGYVASSSQDILFPFIPRALLMLIIIVMFVGGFAIKILAAKAVSVEIYYWKDIFLGRKITEFVVSGPYKYFSNPMYGIGQIQGYATALWYGSFQGLIIAFLNQLLIFLFYFLVEKKFIKRVYVN
jgi:protein-S-isoprenylcysteine O-methyltransferase Ste14